MDKKEAACCKQNARLLCPQYMLVLMSYIQDKVASLSQIEQLFLYSSETMHVL